MEPNIHRLLHGLRLFGASLVVLAASTFLVQQWEAAGDVKRYLALLGLTAALPALAYVCGVRLREGRSARVLLITMLALIPAHAGVLGGFLFSQFGGELGNVASVAEWVAPSSTAAVILVASASAVLVPMMALAYRALCRDHARVLTSVATASYGLVLIPNRSAVVATLLMAPMVALGAWCGAKVKPVTREAKIAVASLFGPSALVLSRQAVFYDPGLAFWGMVLALLAVGLYVVGCRLEDRTVVRFSVVPILLSTGCFWLDLVFRGWDDGPGAGVWLLLYAGLATVPLGAAAWRNGSTRAFFVKTLAGCYVTLTTVALVADPSPWVALAAILVGLSLGSHGYLRRMPAILYLGVALTIPGVAIEVAEAMSRFEPSGWFALAGLGLGLIGATAWLERRARALPQAVDETAIVSRSATTEVPQ